MDMAQFESEIWVFRCFLEEHLVKLLVLIVSLGKCLNMDRNGFAIKEKSSL